MNNPSQVTLVIVTVEELMYEFVNKYTDQLLLNRFEIFGENYLIMLLLLMPLIYPKRIERHKIFLVFDLVISLIAKGTYPQHTDIAIYESV